VTSRPGDIHPYAALCSAAREAIVVNEGTDDRFNISMRIQAYKIGILILSSAAHHSLLASPRCTFDALRGVALDSVKDGSQSAHLKAGRVRRCWQDTLRKSDKPLTPPAHNGTIFSVRSARQLKRGGIGSHRRTEISCRDARQAADLHGNRG
jgi:hypothetical protein